MSVAAIDAPLVYLRDSAGDRAGSEWPVGKIVLVFLAHAVLGILVFRFRYLATAHALGTFAIGVYWALQRSRPERALYAAAYIAGSEVLWRMCTAQIPWESGKYAPVGLFVLALTQMPKWRGHLLSLLYFAMLLPSSLIPLSVMDFEAARQAISFNLSGPLAIMISIWFCVNLELSMVQLRWVFLFFMAPAVAITAITISATYGASAIRFSLNSNFATSAGFGPNQV